MISSQPRSTRSHHDFKVFPSATRVAHSFNESISFGVQVKWETFQIVQSIQPDDCVEIVLFVMGQNRFLWITLGVFMTIPGASGKIPQVCHKRNAMMEIIGPLHQNMSWTMFGGSSK